jgi:predicted phosphodiesterase
MKISILYIAIALFLAGCTDLVEYSPYTADVKDTYINTENVEKLKHLKATHDTVKFAVISDTHSFYKDFEDAISSINQQNDLDFVICSGDITDLGLQWEFEQSLRFIKRLNYPLFTVIGNHDYLSNGYRIYGQMFGPTNMSFSYHQYKFIFFDNIVWENNNRIPDFAWLREQVSSNNEPYSILISHIPADSEEMKAYYSPEFGNIIENSNIMLCINGHNHKYELKEVSGKPCITNGSVSHRSYSIISLYDEKYFIKQIFY